jgi:probable F420-dependent oxidoreductase
MKFGLIESMCDPKHYAPLVRELEATGWHCFYVPDSICYPETSETQYPYSAAGGREFLDGVPFLEPFSLVPALGALTSRLRFATDVVKLPIRNPTLLAKSVATVAVMTDERFSLGAGLSPWIEDFEVCGQDFATRGPRMDEMIEILRGLLRGDYFEYHGKHYELRSIKICPVPKRPVPILIGGHSAPALRRAARLGDGWISAGGDFASLEKMLVELRRLLREHDRDESRFEIHAMAPPDAYDLPGARRLRDLGVTQAIYWPRNPYVEKDKPLAEKLDFVRRLAGELVAKL